MKPRTFLAPLIALAAVLTMVLSLSPGSAHAAPATAAAARLPEHNVDYKAGEIRNSGRFYTQGIVRTGLTSQRVWLQVHPRGGTWHVAQRYVLRSGKYFKFRFDGPVGTCYRLKINRGHGYAEWIGRVGCIVRDNNGKQLPR